MPNRHTYSQDQEDNSKINSDGPSLASADIVVTLPREPHTRRQSRRILAQPQIQTTNEHVQSPPAETAGSNGVTTDARLGDGNGVDEYDSIEPPAKRQRTGSKSARIRQASPPWRERVATGPSFTVVQGRRRSARVRSGTDALIDSSPRPTVTLPTPQTEPTDPIATKSSNPQSPLSCNDTTKAEIQIETPQPSTTRRRRARDVPTPDGRSITVTPTKSPSSIERISKPALRRSARSRKVDSPTTAPVSTRSAVTLPNRRRSNRLSDALESTARADTSSPPPSKPEKPEPAFKIKIPAAAVAAAVAVAANGQSTSPLPTRKGRIQIRVPLPEPAFLRPGAKPAPRKFLSFDDWLRHDDPLQGEEDSSMRGARFDKRVADILRLQDALADGILADRDDIVSNIQTGKRLEPPAVEDPARYYGPVHTHWDNVIAHSVCLRRLMRREGRTHASEAKRIALAVAQEVATNPKWASRRVPVDDDEVWQREEKHQRLRYRQLVKDVTKMWDLVHEAARREKLEVWELEQQEESKRALDNMLDRAKVLVAERQRAAIGGRGGDVREQSNDLSDSENSGLDVSDSESDLGAVGPASDTTRDLDGEVESEVDSEAESAATSEPEWDGESAESDGVEGDDDDEESDSEEEDEPATMWSLYSKYGSEPLPAPESVDEAEPIGEDEPTAEDEPMTEVEPTSEIEPPSEIGLTSEAEPITKSEPAKSTALVPVPTALLRGGTLREYQHRGLDWLANLYGQHTNGILADEMGLGKTIQTISLLAHLAEHHHVWGPHLIVVPTSVMLNWEMEFKKWCPGFRILTYYGTRDERKKKRQGWMKDDMWNVVITSYQLIVHDAVAFKKRKWHYLVLDEAHNIKNFQTQRWQTLLNFRTHSRLLLTGTPLQNSLAELWSLLFFLMPSGLSADANAGFAGLDQFIGAMKKPSDQILEHDRRGLDADAQEAVTKLHHVLRPYILRRLKADVEKQIPAKYEHVVYCRLSKRQRQLYDDFLGRDSTRAALASGNYMNIVNCVMNLRKVCNHPDLFETRPVVTSLALRKSVCLGSLEERRDAVTRWWSRGQTGRLDWLRVTPVGSSRDKKASRLLRRVRDRCVRALDQSPARIQSSFANIATAIEVGRQRSVIEQLSTAARRAQIEACQEPVYPDGLVDAVTIGFQSRPFVRPSITVVDDEPDRLTECGLGNTVADLAVSIATRSNRMRPLIDRFGVVTPAVVIDGMAESAIPTDLVQYARTPTAVAANTVFHDAQVRLSIGFAEKWLLQYDCGKLQVLDRLLRRLEAGGHRALIFTQMTKVLDILESFLNLHGHRYLRLDGSTKIEQRQLLTDQFNSDPRILCFILSSRSGGLGINLTGADTVIFYDLDWNPAMDKQCQDRAHRIGQTRDVHIYRLVSEYTIETNILRKSNQKRRLDDVIIQRGRFTTDWFDRAGDRDGEGDDDDDESRAAATTSSSSLIPTIDAVLDSIADPGTLAAVEDAEDVAAATVAQRELQQTDWADWAETPASVAGDTPVAETPTAGETPAPSSATDKDGPARPDGSGGGDGNAVGAVVVAAAAHVPAHVDAYMLRMAHDALRDVVVVPVGWNERKATGRAGGPGRGRRRGR